MATLLPISSQQHRWSGDRPFRQREKTAHLSLVPRQECNVATTPSSASRANSNPTGITASQEVSPATRLASSWGFSLLL